MLLHLLLGAAAALAGWPAPIKSLAIIAVIGHGLLRRPPASPPLILVTQNAECIVPDWHLGPTPLGPGTVVCPFWIRLELGAGSARRDILLLADQVRPEAWRRLCALLARVRCD